MMTPGAPPEQSSSGVVPREPLAQGACRLALAVVEGAG